MVAQASEALQNGCVSSRQVALGNAGCEHAFKVINALPMPFGATLPNAAIKNRLSQENPPVRADGEPPPSSQIILNRKPTSDAARNAAMLRCRTDAL